MKTKRCAEDVDPGRKTTQKSNKRLGLGVTVPVAGGGTISTVQGLQKEHKVYHVKHAKN